MRLGTRPAASAPISRPCAASLSLSAGETGISKALLELAQTTSVWCSHCRCCYFCLFPKLTVFFKINHSLLENGARLGGAPHTVPSLLTVPGFQASDPGELAHVQL